MIQPTVHGDQPDIAYKVAPPRPAMLGGGEAARLWSKAASAALGLCVPAVLLVAWRVASARELIPQQILPAPSAVAATLVDLARTGELPLNIAVSLGRVLAGFVAGSAVGLLIGAGMGLSRRVEDYLHPTFKALSQVPVLGWLPLLMMLVGIGESLKLILIAKACLVPVALNTLQGIRGVPRSFFEVARVYRFTRAQLLRKVVLPSAVPSIFVGVRYGLTHAWLALVTVELLASSEGLGYLIVWGRQLFQLDLVLASILVVGVVGLLFDSGLAKIEARLLHYRRSAL
ncbi:sulfonate ABC transporter [Sorangium cellulosum]|uniref:Sulfonate ABC transporter n=1 Tax=Sorangium cellulosum TaxID=56 RepID=A0A150P7A2_SORCE|nr:sulfonate ABC transporter [Sorangium cellulosum]